MQILYRRMHCASQNGTKAFGSLAVTRAVVIDRFQTDLKCEGAADLSQQRPRTTLLQQVCHFDLPLLSLHTLLEDPCTDEICPNFLQIDQPQKFCFCN